MYDDGDKEEITILALKLLLKNAGQSKSFCFVKTVMENSKGMAGSGSEVCS